LNFHSAEEAERCLVEQNNVKIDNKAIVLNKKKDSDFDRDANVLVLNLPKELDQLNLSKLFQEFGSIKSCKLEVFKDGTSRGFGYIQFDTKENAEAAIVKLNGTTHGGSKIELKIHSKKDDREGAGEKQFTNLFVSNLPSGHTSEDLRAIFNEFGTIKSCEINAKNNNTGFVSLSSHLEA
jgi:polyadenylate-binding protein